MCWSGVVFWMLQVHCLYMWGDAESIGGAVGYGGVLGCGYLCFLLVV